MVHSLSQKLMGRYFAVLLMASGIVSALVHPLPNLTQMSGLDRSAITTVCVVGGALIWIAPWDRWPRWSLYAIPPIGLGVKMWANLLGGLGPYSYSIHFVLIFVWMGVALPRRASLAFSPLLAAAYVYPLWLRGDPRQSASVAMVVPICVFIGESVAWISSRLREAEEANAERLKWSAWLVEASVDLAHLHELEALTERIGELARELPGLVGIAILLPSGGRMLDVAASSGWTGTLPDRFALAEYRSLVEVLRGNAALDQDDEGCVALARELGVDSLRIAPLGGSKRCVGLILVERDPTAGPVDPFLTSIGRTLSLQAGLAIERMRDRQRLQEQSLHDSLTGLGNRRKADARLERLAPGDAAIVLDLDHFKQVNDREGHAAGDAALKALGAFLSESLREGDEAFRMGGEEFLVVLSQCGDDALLAAERFCSDWRRERPITSFSVGVAVHDEGRSAAATLAAADAALYRAKEGGRDCVVLESS